MIPCAVAVAPETGAAPPVPFEDPPSGGSTVAASEPASGPPLDPPLEALEEGEEEEAPPLVDPPELDALPPLLEPPELDPPGPLSPPPRSGAEHAEAAAIDAATKRAARFTMQS